MESLDEFGTVHINCRMHFCTCRTQRVRVRNEYADRWQAFYEGRWRRVHVQIGRLFIVHLGERITIVIPGI